MLLLPDCYLKRGSVLHQFIDVSAVSRFPAGAKVPHSTS